MCLEKEAPSHSCSTLEACKSCQTGGCDAGGGGRDLGEARDGAAGDWWAVAVAGRGEGTTGVVADKEYERAIVSPATRKVPCGCSCQ